MSRSIQKVYSDTMAAKILDGRRLKVYRPAQKIEHSGLNGGAIAIDITEQKRVACTQMIQQLLDNGFKLREALSSLIQLGIPEADVWLVRGEDLRLPPQDESGKK